MGTPTAQVADEGAAEGGKSTFQTLLPFLAVFGVLAVIGVVAGVAVAASGGGGDGDEEGSIRELNAVTFLNLCDELASGEEAESADGVSACIDEQAAFCSFENAENPFVELVNCSAIGKVCKCGRGNGFGNVFFERNFTGKGNAFGLQKKQIEDRLCVDESEDESCSEVEDASDFFSDSEDSSDTEDESGLDDILEFQADCDERVNETFYICLNEDVQFQCREGVSSVINCKRGQTNTCDGEIGVEAPASQCADLEVTSDDESEDDSVDTEVDESEDVTDDETDA
jgi:hypothetical protein